MLIVLDNCEHLVAAAADLAHRILRETTGATILANSREALGVPGEEIWRVGGLDVPPEIDDDDLPLATAMTYGAMQLFVDRAELAAGGRWRMSQVEVAPVAHICQRLDGIPLALELAAARMKMMTARQIAARIGDRFALLTRGARVHLPRQQTLTALYDWSYNLLEPHEQAMFRRLSVFAGGATLDRICELCECCGALKVDPFDVVSSLVDKSLVVADAGADEPRYRMVETTRDYAWRKLAEAGETHVAIDFARRLARVLERGHALWPHTASSEWFARIAPDVDNLRFALDIAFGAEGDEAVGLDLLSWSVRVWDELSLLEERRRWFSLAVTKLGADADPALAARLWFGSISLIAHGDKSNVEPARKAAELFARAGDSAGEGESLARLGAALLTPISVEAAEPWLHAAERVLRALPEGKPLASCLRSMGLARSFAQDIFGALPLIEQSMAIMRRIGDAHGIASAHITLAEIRYALGDIDDSIRIVRELLESGRQSRRQTTVALGNLAGYLLAQDRIDEARLAMIEGLRTARAVGHSASIARLVEHAALMSALTGEPRRAARLLGYGRAFYARGSASREHTEDVTLARASALVVAALRADEIAALMAEGETLGEAEACEIARGA
jgi:predicted ATPase